MEVEWLDNHLGARLHALNFRNRYVVLSWNPRRCGTLKIYTQFDTLFLAGLI